MLSDVFSYGSGEQTWDRASGLVFMEPGLYNIARFNLEKNKTLGLAVSLSGGREDFYNLPKPPPGEEHSQTIVSIPQ